jgi:hypothetical protein
MKKLTIVTSICVDVITEQGEKILYPQLKNINPQERKAIYWKCVFLFFATSYRCNPTVSHLLLTNDTEDVIIDGVDIKAKLQEWGVEIKILPFEAFNPPKGYSNRFKNAFYKLDVIKYLGESVPDGYYLLLDSDCLWVRKNDSLIQETVSEDFLILYDVDILGHDPSKKLQGMERKDVRKIFDRIEPGYPDISPILFGGEVIGGTKANLKKVADELMNAFQYILRTYKNESEVPAFPNQRNIFSGMEYFTSMVYNRLTIPWKDASFFMRRVWTAFKYTDVQKTDLNLTLWHMPAEKNQGFIKIFRHAIRPNSKFWKTDLNKFHQYLGLYCGVPLSYFNPKRFSIVVKKIVSKFKEIRSED